jgi:hypothetical protein
MITMIAIWLLAGIGALTILVLSFAGATWMLMPEERRKFKEENELASRYTRFSSWNKHVRTIFIGCANPIPDPRPFVEKIEITYEPETAGAEQVKECFFVNNEDVEVTSVQTSAT